MTDINLFRLNVTEERFGVSVGSTGDGGLARGYELVEARPGLARLEEVESRASPPTGSSTGAELGTARTTGCGRSASIAGSLSFRRFSGAGW